jgi:hypothetical protein
MLHASTRTLIKTLCDLTADGVIQWREGDGGSSRFESEGYVVDVSSDPPGVRILNNEGRVIETVTEADLRAASADGADGNLVSRVHLMAESAHRVARGAERAIAVILSSLSAPPARSPEADFVLSSAAAPIATHADNDDGGPAALPDPANDDREETNSPPPVAPVAPAVPHPPRPMRALPVQAGVKHTPRAMFGAIQSFARVTIALEPAKTSQPRGSGLQPAVSAAEPYKPWS